MTRLLVTIHVLLTIEQVSRGIILIPSSHLPSSPNPHSVRAAACVVNRRPTPRNLSSPAQRHSRRRHAHQSNHRPSDADCAPGADSVPPTSGGRFAAGRPTTAAKEQTRPPPNEAHVSASTKCPAHRCRHKNPAQSAPETVRMSSTQSGCGATGGVGDSAGRRGGGVCGERTERVCGGRGAAGSEAIVRGGCVFARPISGWLECFSINVYCSSLQCNLGFMCLLAN